MKSIRDNREALLDAVEELIRRVDALEDKKPTKATTKK